MEYPQRPLVLAVDDTRSDRELLAKILEPEGYAVALAAEGGQGLALAATLQPALILLDVRMPGLDGLEVCRRLKAVPATSAIPVIFLTGQSAGEQILSGFKAGAVDYVTKPFRVLELLARVHVQVELRRAQHEVRTLRGILPTCSCCKKIRDEHGAWLAIESYISQRSEAQFSHGLCPDCLPRYFPDFKGLEV